VGFFQKSIGAFQFVTKFFWLPALNLNFTLGIDGISIIFFIIDYFINSFCIFTSWNSVNKNIKRIFNSFFSFRFFFNWYFLCIRFITFLYFFESVLIQCFYRRCLGVTRRKILAAYYFFLYTLLGSVLMFYQFIYLLSSRYNRL
jgi:NADH-quinone oxidoreductase subunit M